MQLLSMILFNVIIVNNISNINNLIHINNNNNNIDWVYLVILAQSAIELSTIWPIAKLLTCRIDKLTNWQIDELSKWWLI